MTALLNSLFAALSPLWEMSLTAAYAAAVVAVLRFLLKKRAPKQVLCLLWLVVFARLLIPVSLESPVSLVPGGMPRQEQVQPEAVSPSGQGSGTQPDPAPVQPSAPAHSGGVTADPAVQGGPVLTVPGGVTPDVPRTETAAFPWQALLAGVWLAGVLAMGGYALISSLRLRSCLFDAIRAQDGAWEHPAVRSPFILGLFRPRIYLPAGLYGMPRQFILCHERAHLRRLDHIVKPVCWAALAIHWFNPAAWLAFILMSRDIEAACDEAVIRRLGPKVKADYSETLLALAADGHMPAPCPLAFDEGDAKNRIQNVLRYRRPALWIVVVSAVMAVMAAVCLLTDPVSAKDPDPSVSSSQDLSGPLDPWMEEILAGQRNFTSADTGETVNIDLLNGAYPYDTPYGAITLSRFAVVDLDRDGLNELVLWPSFDGDDSLSHISTLGYLILHRQGDAVGSYSLGYRAFGSLKADGSFWFSGSAADSGYAYLRFADGGCAANEVTYSRGAYDETSGETRISYFVDGRSAELAEYNAAIDAWNARPEPVWYVFEDGQPQPYRPSNLELAAETGPARDSGQARLWLEGGEYPWLEWNGVTARLDGLITPAQTPNVYVRDFDQDGQEEAVVTYFLNGYAQYDLYEWSSGGPALADSYDAQDMLLRFNKNNVAAVRPYGDEFALSVTYAHVEGENTPESTDFYRHYVTGYCVLPGDFFDGYEHIRDGYTYAYANGFHVFYLQDETNRFYFDFEIFLADETMQELNYVDTLLAEPPYSDYAGHYILNKPVGAGGFYLSYDGTAWKLEEWDQLTMDYPGNPALPPESSDTPEPALSAAPSATPEPEVIAELDGMRLLSVGNYFRLTWQGQDFPVGPDISYGDRPWLEDFDEDGQPEALFYGHEDGSYPFTIYDIVDGALVSYPLPDIKTEVYLSISASSVAAYNPATGGLTVTYPWGEGDSRRFITATTTLPRDFFTGCEELADGRPLRIEVTPGSLNGVLVPRGLSYRAKVTLTDGTITSPEVGYMYCGIQYSDRGFEFTEPEPINFDRDIRA